MSKPIIPGDQRTPTTYASGVTYNAANQTSFGGRTCNSLLHGADGKKLATYTYTIITYNGNPEIQLVQQSQNVYFLGKLISAEGNAVTTDRLGSVRTGGPGGLGYQAQYPYGVEYTATANDREKYATYTRDGVTGLDYAVNRYYSSQWGRFMSPDSYSGSVSLGNPQSWNRYAYVGGDPVNGNDPFGLFLSGPGAPDDTPGQVWAYDPTDDNWMALALMFGGCRPHPLPLDPLDASGGGVPRLLTVRNVQKSGKEYNTVAKTLQNILDSIDPDCLAYLQSGGNNLSDYVAGLLSNSLLAVADFAANLAAFTGTFGTDLAPGTAAIVVNNNGAFFNGDYTVDQGAIQGGTAKADVFIMLHELGHALGANEFQNDYNNIQAGHANDQLIQQHCQRTLSQFQ